jgi:DNA-damage-inducible protein D
MQTDLQNINSPIKGFDDIREIDENGNEFWRARNLFEIFGYSQWRDFESPIKRAKISCVKSGQYMTDHFADLTKMVYIGSNTVRKVKDYKLDRYACYLIAQNGDSKIQQIALAQTYFAIQTRKQELYNLDNDVKRLKIREEIKKENKKLFSTAKESGVTNFGSFNDAGYLGLYGINLLQIEKKKNLKKGELLDRAGGVELAANLFRITQTEDKLKQDKIKDQTKANIMHNRIGGKVRQTIKDIGGTLPENLKTEKHIKEIKKSIKLLNKK